MPTQTGAGRRTILCLSCLDVDLFGPGSHEHTAVLPGRSHLMCSQSVFRGPQVYP